MKARYLVCVGLVLRRRRESAGLTQSALASLVGLSRGSVANIETGVQNMTVLGLASIAETLGTTASNTLAEAEHEMAQSWNAA